MRFRRHLSYANVAATLALIVAIAGGATAVAGSKIGAQDLKKIKVRTATGSPSAGKPAIAVAQCRKEEKLLGGGGSAEPSFNGSSPSGNRWVVVGTTSGSAVAAALCLAR
jgi:hypothetical protein